MEEDNDSKKNKGILGQVQDNAKQKLKNKAKNKILAKIIPVVLPIIGIILIVLLIIGLILLIVTTISNSIKTFLGLDSNSSATVEQDVKGAIYLSDDGKNYKINDDYINKIIEDLEKGAVDTNATGLTYSQKNSKDENGNVKESMIRNYVKAEIKTMFPKIGSSEVDGLVEIERDTGEEGTNAKKLNYVPYQTLKEYVNNNDTNAENYFSLNPNTFQLCYATINIKQIYDEKGNKINEETDVNLNEVEYQYLVSAYAMPSNFTISTHFIAQDENFMKDILKLLEKDKEIILTLEDTIQTTTTTVDYSGKIYDLLNETANYTKIKEIDEDDSTSTNSHSNRTTGQVSVNISREYDVNNENVSTYYNNLKNFKEVKTYNSTQLVLTKANTWIANKEDICNKSSYTDKQDPTIVEIKEPENDGEYNKISEETINDLRGYNVDVELQEAVDSKANDDETITINNIHIITNRKIDIKETTNEEIKQVVCRTTNKTSNVDNIQQIIDLINNEKYKKVKNNLITSADFYFSLLNQDEKTQNIEQAMRYVLYKVSGKDYGVKEYSYSDFEKAAMSSITIGSGGASYEDLNLTESDLQILYKITSAERGDGTQQQQEYVVSVILNRVLSSKFPNTVHDVVFAPMQFQPTRNGAYERANPSATTIAAVDNVVKTGDKAKCAVYFMTPASSLGQQSWLCNCQFLFNDTNDSLKDTRTSGSHNFYTTQEVISELQKYMPAGNGSIVDSAIAIHKYVRERGYKYLKLGIRLPNINGNTIDCSSYVTWVLINAGVSGFTDGMFQWNSNTFNSNPQGWQTISLQYAEPGDILVYSGHVEIVAATGSDKFIVYNCGGNSSIGSEGSPDLPETSTSGHRKSQIIKILRVP